MGSAVSSLPTVLVSLAGVFQDNTYYPKVLRWRLNKTQTATYTVQEKQIVERYVMNEDGTYKTDENGQLVTEEVETDATVNHNVLILNQTSETEVKSTSTGTAYLHMIPNAVMDDTESYYEVRAYRKIYDDLSSKFNTIDLLYTFKVRIPNKACTLISCIID